MAVDEGSMGKQALQVQQIWPWEPIQPLAPRQTDVTVNQTITQVFIDSALLSIKLTFLLID